MITFISIVEMSLVHALADNVNAFDDHMVVFLLAIRR